MNRRVLLPAAVLFACACARSAPETPDFDALRPVVENQPSGVTALLQAVSVVDSSVAWISGHDAIVLRTTDGGRSWTRRPVPGAPDSLQFRDIHAFDARIAYILSAGPGELSRIYRTDDGGATWTLQWMNQEPAGFYDCFDFWSAERGVLYGDAVDGGLRILTTEDGGRTWRRVPAEALPAAQAGEGGFAASGLCARTRPGGRAWIAAGNAARARVFRTSDYGRTWSAAEVPVVAGEAAGLAAISMVDDRVCVAFGGNLAVNDRATENVAATTDGGATWTAMPALSINGAAYGGTHIGGARDVLIAVGPGGAAISRDAAQTWSTVDARAWWSVGSKGADATWLAGPNGRITRLRWERDEMD
jgi:photosystem II stability/assembly factor-like uncharacterized protein